MQITLVDGCEIIQRMLELLSQETDETCHEWASVIIEDLIDHAQELFKSKKSKDLFLYAIQLPGDPDPIPARLQVRIAYPHGGMTWERRRSIFIWNHKASMSQSPAFHSGTEAEFKGE